MSTPATRLPARPDRGLDPRLDRGRARALGAVAGAVTTVVVFGLLVAAGAVWNDGGATGQVTTAAFESYLAEVEPVAKEAGRVVQMGLKAGITDIGESRYADGVLVGMADGWAGELEALREQLVAVSPPPSLVDAHDRLVEGMDGYLAVAAALGEAARAPDGSRADLVRVAAGAGEDADDTWDQGAAALQTEARRLGLPDVSWLPQPTQGDRP